MFDADGGPLLVLASGAHRVDTAKVTALVGARKVRRATPEFVLEATGQEVGGVAPVGHPAPLRTVVDVDLAAHPLLWAAVGALVLLRGQEMAAASPPVTRSSSS